MSTILLVEDEELNRTLVKAVLSRSADPVVRDATVVDAISLAAARTRIAADHIDLILLDMNLPDGNGLTLARELSESDAPKPTVVAVTASVLPQDRAAALEAGCDDFLDKPYAAADLIATIARHLNP
ncbi:response regulator [Paractinoplanes rhizophilus]|jgi:two-component system KDP operon response regulator KdpE|uniref:Response regulator n=1 Tax=Paractinoplanes rhizophilus TaxID=1416877 RepID=A0ABW2HT11_9ACTN|nr:response regulator [Actinoplanes sp.]